MPVLLACVFVVMIGFGITLPVLPFYVERLALADGATRQQVVMHVGLLTGVYALMQLIFAPVWGRLSDRTGRRPLVLIGIGGYVVAQRLFGLSTYVVLLTAARKLGGILSSATLPVTAVFQVGAVAVFSVKMRELSQIGLGFGVTGAGLTLVSIAASKSQVFRFVGMLALGLAVISPNLAAMISKHGGRGSAGQALEFLNAVNSCGQARGSLVRVALLLWNGRAPFVVSGALCVAAADVTGWMARSDKEVPLRDCAAQGTTR